MIYSFTMIKYGHEEKFRNITEELYNKTIDDLKYDKEIKFVQEWSTEYNNSILYAKEYRFECNVLILWKEVIKSEYIG